MGFEVRARRDDNTRLSNERILVGFSNEKVTIRVLFIVTLDWAVSMSAHFLSTYSSTRSGTRCMRFSVRLCRALGL